jgi:hypothetical protein
MLVAGSAAFSEIGWQIIVRVAEAVGAHDPNDRAASEARKSRS